MRSRHIGKGFKLRRRNAMPRHESFAKRFGAFQLRSGFCRPKDAQTFCTKLIHHASSQRRFWPDHGECYFFSSSKAR